MVLKSCVWSWQFFHMGLSFGTFRITLLKLFVSLVRIPYFHRILFIRTKFSTPNITLLVYFSIDSFWFMLHINAKTNFTSNRTPILCPHQWKKLKLVILFWLASCVSGCENGWMNIKVCEWAYSVWCQFGRSIHTTKKMRSSNWKLLSKCLKK